MSTQRSPANGLAGEPQSIEPTPLIRPVPPPEAYPVAALGPILGPAARAIAEIVQVPDALAANSVLAAAALTAQSHGDIETLGGARPLSLFILTIAGSGDRKTAADHVALTPIRDYGRRLTLSYRSQFMEWERAAAAHKFDKSRARQDARNGDDYAQILREISEEPRPRKPWIMCSEPTAEGLMRSLAEGQYAQGIYTDEGGQFIGGYALSDEAELRTIAMLSCAWQGSPLDRVRATDHEHVVLHGRRLSIHLLVQPDVATKMLGRPLYRSQGFLARWLIAAPDSLAGSRRHDPSQPAPADHPRIRRYWHAIGQLLEQPVVEDDEVDGLDPPRLALSAEAHGLLVTAYDEIESAQRRDGALEGIREWASKAAEHACRIAGVLTLVADPAATVVGAEAMGGAIEIMRHYLSEYERLIGMVGVSDSIRHAQDLLEWLRRTRRETVTPRDVMRLGPGRAIRSADVAKVALRILTEHGWLTTELHRTYRVHPTVFTGSGQ